MSNMTRVNQTLDTHSLTLSRPEQKLTMKINKLTLESLVQEWAKAEQAFLLICGAYSAPQSLRTSANDFACKLRRDIFARVPNLRDVSLDSNGNGVLSISEDDQR